MIQDDPTGVGADEGRAMLQIVHDIAPKAKECFATAETRRPRLREQHPRARRPERPVQGQRRWSTTSATSTSRSSARGPISDAVDDVAAQGVHYFSSAGNGSSQQAYAAPLRIVQGAPGLSNINLAGVDPELYAGGFEDFDPGPGTDIAQSMVLGGDPTSDDGGADGILDLQWDDPVDANGAPLGDPLIDTTGEITAAQPVAKIPFTGTAGQTIRAIVDAIPSGSTDFILTLKDPAGNILQQVDTGTSPEVVVQTLPTAGTYSFEVSGFAGDLGDFTFKVQPVLGSSKTTTDLNALFFDDDGNFLFAAQDLNQLSGKPFEIAGFHGRGGAAAGDRQGQHRRRRRHAAALPALRRAGGDRVRAAAGARASTATRSPTARPRSRPRTRSGRSRPRTTRRSAAICRSTSTPTATGCRSPTSATCRR